MKKLFCFALLFSSVAIAQGRSVDTFHSDVGTVKVDSHLNSDWGDKSFSYISFRNRQIFKTNQILFTFAFIPSGVDALLIFAEANGGNGCYGKVYVAAFSSSRLPSVSPPLGGTCPPMPTITYGVNKFFLTFDENNGVAGKTYSFDSFGVLQNL